MKKFVIALLTSVFFLLVAAKSAEASLLCTPRLYTLNPAWTANHNVDAKFLPIPGNTFPSDSGPIYVGFSANGETLNAQSVDKYGIHWCWNNTEGTGLGSTACASGSMGSTYIPKEQLEVYGDMFIGQFYPFTGTGQENTQWQVVPWENGGLGSFGDVENNCNPETISVTAPSVAFSCNNPGTSFTATKIAGDTSIHVGINVAAANMDNSIDSNGNPIKHYRAMIKGEGARDFGGGWSIDLIKDGENYEGGSTFTQGGDHFGDGDYTVVIADTSNFGCNVITDNFDIRNCQVFPQCIARLTVKGDDPNKQTPYEDRDQVIDQAAGNRLAPDTITPFSLCRQIPVLTSAEIQAQVSQVKDAKKAADLQKELTARAQNQQEEKSQCCQCMYGTRFFDKNTGSCQGEGGTAITRQRPGFKPGLYTAVGCIGADSESIVTRLVRIGLGIAGGVALLMILTGAFMFTTSQGEPKRASEAKELITSAVLGLIFIIFSVTLLQFIGVNILHIPGFGSTDTTGTTVNQQQ